MARLGKNQLEQLARFVGTGRAYVVGDKQLRRLRDLGMMRAVSEERDSFFTITSAGLRAVADAMDDGRIPPLSVDDFRKAMK
jgi:hypothetical protein